MKIRVALDSNTDYQLWEVESLRVHLDSGKVVLITPQEILGALQRLGLVPPTDPKKRKAECKTKR